MLFARVQRGGLQPHALTFDSGSEIGSNIGSAPGSGAPTPGDRSPARSASPAPRSPLIGGSTMTSTNPAFASNLYDSTYSDEGARNPIFQVLPYILDLLLCHFSQVELSPYVRPQE